MRRITAIILSLLGASLASWGAEVSTLAPAEAAARVAAGTAVLVDVREPAEWQETGVVASAHQLALSDLRGERVQWRAFLAAHHDKEIILYCRSGNRSGQAAKLLAAEGFKTANAGGLRDWTAAGQPTRRADEPRQD
jgi:rhodanese-related sulfurtransferase